MLPRRRPQAFRCQWVSGAGERCENVAATGSHLCADHSLKGTSWLSPAWEAIKRSCQRAAGEAQKQRDPGDQP